MESEVLNTIDIALVLVIAFLTCLLGYGEYQNRKERAKLINLIVAKDAKEAVNLQLADQTKIEPAKPEQELRDIKSLDELSDEEYDKFIQGQLNN